MNNSLPNRIEEVEYPEALNSIRMLADQLEDSYKLVLGKINPQKCQLARRVLICGMGGSALGGRVIKSVFGSHARSSIEIVNHYQIPKSIGSDTLVIISSYSGNTEETVSAYHQAIAQGAQVFIITSGGMLSQMPEGEAVEKFIFATDKNPSLQPRMGLGYSLGCMLAILSSCHFISLTDEQLGEAVKELRIKLSDFAVDKPENTNGAKNLASALMGRVPILVASEHLLGSTHVFKNQLNETAKNFAISFALPELNHHLMEGLKRPPELKKLLTFVLFTSDLYFPEVQKRYPITQEVLKQQEIDSLEYHLSTQTRLAQAFELIALSSYTQLYLAILYGEDPGTIPWVDYFKKSLANTHA